MKDFNCQICKCTSYKLLHTESINNLNFNYGICKKCSFISQVRIHDKNIYVNLPYQTQKNYKSHSINRANYIYDFSKQYLKNVKSALDIGCSRGGVMYQMQKLLPNIDITGCTVLGKDETLIDNSLNIINKDFNDISFDTKYDYIIMAHILEHFVDIRKSLRKLKSIMHKKTVTYIEVPWIDYLKVRISSEFYPEHISYFTPHSLKNLLLSEGFNILDIKSSKYWGNIKVVITKNLEKKIHSIDTKYYLLYIIEKSVKKMTHWFYKLKFKYSSVNSND